MPTLILFAIINGMHVNKLLYAKTIRFGLLSGACEQNANKITRAPDPIRNKKLFVRVPAAAATHAVSEIRYDR